MTQVPVAPPPPSSTPTLDRWLYLLWKRVSSSGQMLWGYLDFGGSNLTDLETRNHEDLQNHNTADYYHLTADERTDILGASYLTLSTSGSLTNERTLAVGTGLSKTDGGAGSTLTLNPVAFVGDDGTGGFIGAVPAPVAGDGDPATRKFLCADGIWRLLDTSDHNQLLGLEGGVATQVFEPSAFESTAFKTTGATEYYHLDAAAFNDIARVRTVLTTVISTTLTDDAATCLVAASGLTITLPNATGTRVGSEWVVCLTVTGNMTIAADASDTIITSNGSDTSVYVDSLASSLKFRCVSPSLWIIT